MHARLGVHPFALLIIIIIWDLSYRFKLTRTVIESEVEGDEVGAEEEAQ